MAAKGVAKEDILLGAYCDRNREHEPQDVYLLATSKELWVLFGVFAGKHSHSGHHHYEATWEEANYCTYPLDSISRFQIEELISGSRFTALTTRGEPIFITAMTNFCRTSMILFKKYLDIIRREGSLTLDPADDPKENCCPKCGHRYPEKNRKICPRCMEKGRLFRRISVFFLQYKLDLAISLFSLIAMTALSIWATNLSSGFFIKNVLTDTENKFYGAVITVLCIIIGVKIFSMLATVMNNYATSIIAAKVNFNLKKTIFSAIERLSLSFFTSRQTVSIWLVWGNISTGWIFLTLYPFLMKYLKSRAKVSGLHET